MTVEGQGSVWRKRKTNCASYREDGLIASLESNKVVGFLVTGFAKFYIQVLIYKNNNNNKLCK